MYLTNYEVEENFHVQHPNIEAAVRANVITSDAASTSRVSTYVS